MQRNFSSFKISSFKAEFFKCFQTQNFELLSGLGHFRCIHRLALRRTRKETFSCREVLSKLVELLSSGLVELSLYFIGLLGKGPIKLECLSFQGEVH